MVYFIIAINVLFGSILFVRCSERSCSYYDADTGKLVSNFSSTSRLEVDCSMRGFSEVPHLVPSKTVILNLRANNISNIPNFAFKLLINLTHLDLSANQISKFHTDSFSGLSNLESLFLNGNELCLPAGYTKGVFKDLKNLKSLKTFSNGCKTGHTDIPDKEFQNLRSLEELSLDVTDNFIFGKGFKMLKKLKKLDVSSSEGICNNITVTKDSFHGLAPTITDLTLRGCAYRKIENGSLDAFPNLKTLNFACARNLDPFMAIYSMKNPTLETLILDGMLAFGKSSLLNFILKIAETLDAKLKIKLLEKLLEKLPLGDVRQPFCHLNFQNLKRLSLRANSLAYKPLFHKDGQACTPLLHHLNIGMNPMLFVGKYVPERYIQPFLEDGIPIEEYWSLTNIRTVDISGLFSSWYKFNYPFCSAEEIDSESYFVKLPKVVEDTPDVPNFNVSSGFVKSTPTENGTDLHGVEGLLGYQNISPGTQVLVVNDLTGGLGWPLNFVQQCPYIVYPVDVATYLNFANNNISFLDCPVLGIKSLKAIDGRNCQGKTVHVDSLKRKYVPNIELLYLQGNRLNSSLFPHIFIEAVSLREIDLSFNDLRFLPNDSFTNLANLEKLSLSENNLKSADLLISKMTKLNILDLSFNAIPSLSGGFQRQLEFISRHNPNFKIKLEGNPFSCDCNSLDFLKWIQSTNVTIEQLHSLTCVNSSILLFHVDTLKLSKECLVSYFQYYMIIASLSLFLVLMVTVISITYRKRYKIAWHLITMQRRMMVGKYARLKECEIIYKAFVAYHIDHEINPSDVGLPWVKNHLRYFVEEKWGEKLFLFDRNALVGPTKIRQIIFAIEKSEKVIFALTETFLKTGYWEIALHAAMEKGLCNIIMCCLGDVPGNKMPREFAKVINALQKEFPGNYLQFPDEFSTGPDLTDDRWKSLRLTLNCVETDSAQDSQNELQ